MHNFCKEHFGDLGDPNLIVLSVSSHDWNDRMTFATKDTLKTCRVAMSNQKRSEQEGTTMLALLQPSRRHLRRGPNLTNGLTTRRNWTLR